MFLHLRPMNYLTGNAMKNWKFASHHCHDIFQKTIAMPWPILWSCFLNNLPQHSSHVKDSREVATDSLSKQIQNRMRFLLLFPELISSSETGEYINFLVEPIESHFYWTSSTTCSRSIHKYTKKTKAVKLDGNKSASDGMKFNQNI